VSDRAAFVARYGGLFEHSPWVAEAAWEDGPFADDDAALAAMVTAVQRAPRERQLALIRAHPDLGTKARMTPDSTREQSGAGLDRLTPDEYEARISATDAYKDRFGMPFVICVGEHDKRSIIAAAQGRVRNDPDAEVDTALREVAKIAKLRMERM
jgi:2-oxo-4-hydroxy-4-carboxy-5-ureidoimidazoline decarboxylase